MNDFFNNANGKMPITARAKFVADYTATFTDKDGKEFSGSWNTGDMVSGKISDIESKKYFTTSRSGVFPDPSGITIQIPADDESIVSVSQLDSTATATMEHIPNQEMRNVQEIKKDGTSSKNWLSNPVTWVVGAIAIFLGFKILKK